MESEDPVAMTSELRKLSEALMRFVGEFETHRSLLTQQCVKMDKCEGMLDEIRTSQKELESKRTINLLQFLLTFCLLGIHWSTCIFALILITLQFHFFFCSTRRFQDLCDW